MSELTLVEEEGGIFIVSEGVQGPRGIQGIQGPRGIQGIQGEVGDVNPLMPIILADTQAARDDAAASAAAASASEANAANSATAAATQAGNAATSAGAATSKAADALASANASAGSATTALDSKTAAATSETNAANSANLAASNTLSQLTAVKTQTEAARDAALAGLGAADQSQNLVVLAEGLRGAYDFLGQMPGLIPVSGQQVEALLITLTLALDVAGVVARQVAGGSVQLAAGTAVEPSLWAANSRKTGVMFPAADALALATTGLERLRMDAGGNLGLGTSAPSGLLDVNDNRLRVRTAKTPASAAAAGNAGEWCWDGGFFYVCTATNTWKRTALATW